MAGNTEEKPLGLYHKVREKNGAQMETIILAIFLEEERKVMVYINLATA